MPHRLTPQQLDLFSPPDMHEPSPAPRWQSLPDEARLTLTGLMVRLILAHAASADALRGGGGRKGAEHDA